MNDILRSLQQRYPLSTDWEIPEVFEDRLELGSLRIGLSGLVASRKRDGFQVTGSAAQLGEAPIERAYFELLERTALFEIDPKHSEHFPLSSEPATWQYSKSNGVALHTSFSIACEKAAFELIERDRVLRSWFRMPSARAKPIEASVLEQCPIIRPLEDLYDFSGYTFSSEDGRRDEDLGYAEQVYVIGIFGFPKKTSKQMNAPFLYGFGADLDFQACLSHAVGECLQRLGFLWGEDWTSALPEFSPTPDFHQEFFLREGGIFRIKRWLDNLGKETEMSFDLRRKEVARESLPQKMQFIDLTPVHLKGRVSVVKAMSPERLPLVFGLKPPSNTIDEELWIHPIA